MTDTRDRTRPKRLKLRDAITALVDDSNAMAEVAHWSAVRKNGSYDIELRALAKYLGLVVRAIDSVPAKAPSTLPERDLRVLGTVANLAIRRGRPAKMAEMARQVAKEHGGSDIAARTRLKRIRRYLDYFNRVPEPVRPAQNS